MQYEAIKVVGNLTTQISSTTVSGTQYSTIPSSWYAKYPNATAPTTGCVVRLTNTGSETLNGAGNIYK